MIRFRKRALLFLLLLSLLAGGLLAFSNAGYRADREALGAMTSTDAVLVKATAYGWHFDGPSREQALIFYPGAMVEERAYAPILRRLAEAGLDVCLVKMPFHLAIFGRDRATAVMRAHDYPRWYVGGHSLGGAMAADFAASHGDDLAGVILLAAYPVKKLKDSLSEICVYGTCDTVLNREKLEAGRALAPRRFAECALQGGNHAQFGNYGKQRGDGEALISADEQQRQSVGFIIRCLT